MGFFDKFRVNRVREDETEKIIRNIQSLFQTRRGFGSVDDRLGMSDISVYNADRNAVVRQAKAEIERNIEHFEPRVEVLDIEEDTTKRPKLILNIDLKVKATGQRLSLSIDRYNKDIQPLLHGLRERPLPPPENSSS